MLETFKFEFYKKNPNDRLELEITPIFQKVCQLYGFSGTYILFPVTSVYPNENLLTVFDQYSLIEFAFSPKHYIPEEGTILFGTPYQMANNIDDLLQWNQDVCNFLDNDC